MLPSTVLMRSARSRISLRRCAASLIVAALALLLPSRVRTEEEVRALWVVRTTLTSRAAIETMIAAARTSGFNTLLVQIRGRADAYYSAGVEPRASALSSEPALDPLATTLALAHDAGLQVHAWVNVNLVAGANELPAARDHVIYRHPEWLMVPRALAEDFQSIDPRSPQYLGRLARYVRGQSNAEGLYLSPASDAAVDYTADVVRAIVSRYAVDGVHFDYIRYPSDDFDYSRDALSAFRRTLLRDLQPVEARRLDARVASEPLAYTQTFPDRWRAFRVSRLTGLMQRLREVVKAARPGATVSAAVVPDADEALARRLQNWRAWLDEGLLDVICPMAYTTDSSLFATQIAGVRQAAGAHPVWAGIGAYRLSSDQIIENVQTARRLGAGGVILFSYDSLTGPPHGTGYLSQIARAAFISQF
jgi:uncharacterized lipoprotein YddW (UPF0748 family)